MSRTCRTGWEACRPTLHRAAVRLSTMSLWRSALKKRRGRRPSSSNQSSRYAPPSGYVRSGRSRHEVRVPSHRRRGYRSWIVTESNKPAKGECVDVSPDTGFFETLGQAVHPARKDRTQGRRGTDRRARSCVAGCVASGGAAELDRATEPAAQDCNWSRRCRQKASPR
jgi:hypothetical protein